MPEAFKDAFPLKLHHLAGSKRLPGPLAKFIEEVKSLCSHRRAVKKAYDECKPRGNDAATRDFCLRMLHLRRQLHELQTEVCTWLQGRLPPGSCLYHVRNFDSLARAALHACLSSQVIVHKVPIGNFCSMSDTVNRAMHCWVGMVSAQQYNKSSRQRASCQCIASLDTRCALHNTAFCGLQGTEHDVLGTKDLVADLAKLLLELHALRVKGWQVVLPLHEDYLAIAKPNAAAERNSSLATNLPNAVEELTDILLEQSRKVSKGEQPSNADLARKVSSAWLTEQMRSWALIVTLVQAMHVCFAQPCLITQLSSSPGAGPVSGWLCSAGRCAWQGQDHQKQSAGVLGP